MKDLLLLEQQILYLVQDDTLRGTLFVANHLDICGKQYLPPFQGEVRGGDGVKTVARQPHPPPDLPLEGGGTINAAKNIRVSFHNLTSCRHPFPEAASKARSLIAVPERGP